ncbi:MAG: hypothetical protein ABI281_13095 [Caldimonas sp.]
MNTISTFSRLRASVVAAAFMGLAFAASAQPAAGGADAPATSAAQACEREARQALAGRVAGAVKLTFNTAPEVRPYISNENQTVLRGVARWQRGTEVRSIQYSCTVDLASFKVGLVIRDATPAPAETPARAPAEPDLSALSPAACESRAAAALKKRWPRVSEIAFDPATRSFGQPSAGIAIFRGNGRAVPTPGAPHTFFAFECEIDPRDGWVLRSSLKP